MPTPCDKTRSLILLSLPRCALADVRDGPGLLLFTLALRRHGALAGDAAPFAASRA